VGIGGEGGTPALHNHRPGGGRPDEPACHLLAEISQPASPKADWKLLWGTIATTGEISGAINEGKMKVKDISTPDPQCISPDAS